MKKKLSIFGLSFFLFYFLLLSGCKQHEENHLERNIKEFIKNENDDIRSIKIIGFEKIDSVSLRESIEREKARLDSFISYSQNQVGTMNREINYLQTTAPTDNQVDADIDNKETYEDEIKKNREMLDYLNKVDKATDIENTCAYTYLYKTEARMKSGDIDFIDFLVVIDYQDSIIQVTKNPKNIQAVPCKIPGYEDKYEMLQNEYNN
jgi:hypothetical protein